LKKYLNYYHEIDEIKFKELQKKLERTTEKPDQNKLEKLREAAKKIKMIIAASQVTK
jgi:uncharacterized membrane protein (DUF106 family)